jgi:hypothetical protein
MNTDKISNPETPSMDDQRLLAPVYWGLIAESYPSVVHVSVSGGDKTLCGRSKGMILEQKMVKESKWFWDEGGRSTEIPENRFCKNCFKHFK